MSKKALAMMIEDVNFWPQFTGKGKLLDINSLTQEDATKIFHKIDGGLSPENLHCDGEISPAQARVKYNMYMGAVKELLNMGFTMPSDVYEIPYA